MPTTCSSASLTTATSSYWHPGQDGHSEAVNLSFRPGCRKNFR
ncbi:hypothetical protein ACWEQ8_12890 [Streptomyces noursei]|nr:hypothetical protein [Streptomyces noursei]